MPGVPPRQDDPGDSQPRPDHAALGYGDRPADWPAAGAPRQCPLGFVQRRRPPARNGSAGGLACFWRVAPQISGNVERISCWVRVTTDLDFDSGDAVRKLDPLIGRELRRRLHEFGGPPPKKIERW